MTLERLARFSAWLLLVCAIGFVFYLYPGPDVLAERLTSSGATAESAVSEASKAEIRDAFRRSWLANLLLFLFGTTGAVLWLWRGTKALARWMAIAAVAIFLAMFLFLIIPSRVASVSEWVPYQLDFLGKLWRANGWSFLLAELHRMFSVAVSLLALVAFVPPAIRGVSRSSA
jgi:hypothetical protein